MKNYTVALGDTLFGIAARKYGDGELYPVIARMNNLANPDLILVGQELLVPFVTRRHLWTTDDTPPPGHRSPSTTTEHRTPRSS